MNTLNFLLPGDPGTRTGGYIYDARISCGLRARGWTVHIRQLHDSFPMPDDAALAHARQQLAVLEDGALVLIDGLAFGAMPALAQHHRERLTLIALVHHPLAAETGLSARQRTDLAVSEKKALAAAHHVIVTSSRTAADVCAHYNVPVSKLSIVTPGTDPVPQFETGLQRRTQSNLAAISVAKSTCGAAHEAAPITRLLCVATVTPRKGHVRLIEALAPLAGQRWQLRCAGSVSQSPHTVRRLRAAIHEAGLNEQVQLLGELDPEPLRACYQWADAFVLATQLEGYGMALAEAIAHGLPVITTAGGAAADTVGDEAALLVPGDDVNALSNALQRLLLEPSLRARLATAARERARQLPSWEDASSTMHDVLKRVQSA